MLLKFIGEDGSMGLKKGKYYDCYIESHDEYIWVTWKDGLTIMSCPYDSIGKLAENWG